MSTPQSITDLILGSGNNFHAKVARWFTANGWHTSVSPYYMDQSQAKARELDLVVEKIWPFKNGWGHHEGNVLVRLYVECKFIPGESVFWFAPKNIDEATKLVCSFNPFRENNSYTSKHHYLSTNETVAKLFASSNTKLQENEPFFKALNQALSAVLAMRGRLPQHPTLKKGRTGKTVTLEYPVIVCSSFSQLYSADFLKEIEPSSIENNFQMEVQYAHLDRDGNPQDEYFLLDIVEFNQLSSYESVLSEGAHAAGILASDS